MPDLTFVKRLFGRSEKSLPPPLRGGLPAPQTAEEREEQSAVRTRMEAEVADDRERRRGADEGSS